MTVCVSGNAIMEGMETADLIERLQQGAYGDTPAEIIALAKDAAAINDGFSDRLVRDSWLTYAQIPGDAWAKLISIARAEPLHEPEVLKLLPASFSTIALLSRCSEKEFEKALSEGVIHPKLSHRALAAWRKEQEEKQPSREPVLRLLPIAIALDPEADAMDELAIQTAIQEAINRLAVRGELIQLQNWESIDEQASHQWRRARIKETLEQVNTEISPQVLTMADLCNPLGQLKDDCAALSREKWITVNTLKSAHDALYAPTKQKRYASRIRLQNAADGGDEYARRLVKDLLGDVIEKG
jgi:hypothetical protein